MKKTRIFLAILVLPEIFWAQGPPPDKDSTKPKVRYTRGQKLEFESLLIEGQLKRPEMSVVTGNAGGEDDGLLKLREHFVDQIAMEAGEAIP